MATGYYPYFIALDGHEGTRGRLPGTAAADVRLQQLPGPDNAPQGARGGHRGGQEVRHELHRIALPQRHAASCTSSSEAELADYVGKPAALVFSTGYQTNLGTITALVGRGDYTILDKDDHASIVDGAQMAFGEMKRFRHNDLGDLERVLALLPETAGKLVIVDGLFSMEGDIAPLPEMIPIVKKYGARLMVDDAHAHRRAGRRPRHGGPLRRHRRGRSDHVHLQQVLRQPGRLHRRRLGCHRATSSTTDAR